MLLTIDVGNTQTVLGLFEGEHIVEHWRLATDPRRSADELGLLVTGLLAASASDGAVDGIACCSTVPSALREVRSMCERWLHPERGRRRPHREHPRRVHPARRAGHRRRRRDLDELRRRICKG
jgi:pantothenate kinase type III